jgi:organic radical activating enzyme
MKQMLNVQEIFYSIQGEGSWTGTPVVFIRLSGCNLNCSFCDTIHDQQKPMSVDEIIKEVLRYPSQKVVLTGGEPLIQPVGELLDSLCINEFKVHLETNGTQPIQDNFNSFAWIAISPKSTVETLNKTTFRQADEIKFLCGLPGWEEYIEEVRMKMVIRQHAQLYLMPIAKSKHLYKGLKRSRDEIIEVNVETAKSYCLHHPEFSLCVQFHKYLGIR